MKKEKSYSHLQKKIEELIKFFGNQTKTAEAINTGQGNLSACLNGKWSIGCALATRIEEATDGKFLAIDFNEDLKEYEAMKQRLALKKSRSEMNQ